jgi:hypothetical protein
MNPKIREGNNMVYRNEFKAALALAVILLTGCSKFDVTSPGLSKSSQSSAASAVGTAKSGQMSAEAVANINDAKNPCHPVRIACLNAGFVLGDSRDGNRLIHDCMKKLIANEVATSLSGKIAVPPSKVELLACAPHIHTEHKPDIGTKSRAIPTYKN